jgi:hypothetical protein
MRPIDPNPHYRPGPSLDRDKPYAPEGPSVLEEQKKAIAALEKMRSERPLKPPSRPVGKP